MMVLSSGWAAPHVGAMTQFSRVLVRLFPLAACLATLCAAVSSFASSGEGLSPQFVLDTRLLGTTGVGYSATFALDTRGILRDIGVGYSDSFVIDTRGAHPNGGLFVDPQGPLVFTQILVGTWADRTFTVRNTGTASINGSALTLAPFSIVGGSPYSLSPGQSRTVTVRYHPTSAGDHIGTVVFTGGLGQTRQVYGSAFTSTQYASVYGTVTDSSFKGIQGIRVKYGASGLGGASTDKTGQYRIDGLHTGLDYTLEAWDPSGRYQGKTIHTGLLSAGQSKQIDFVLAPISNPQPVPKEIPVVLVRGLSVIGEDSEWRDGDKNSQYGYWYDVREALTAQEFQSIWDCNNPEDGVLGGHGHVIDGKAAVTVNAKSLTQYVRDKAIQFKNDPLKGNGHYPAKINVVAHSMGGLIARQAISTNGGAFRFDGLPTAGSCLEIKVDKFVMLGTPNAGSPIADIVYGRLPGCDQLLNWLGLWDAIRDLETFNVIDFNNMCRWPNETDTRVWLMAGDTYPSDKKSLLYWGHWAIVLYQMQHLLPPVSAVSDGAVPRPSVSGAYYQPSLLPPFYKRITSFTCNPIQDLERYYDHSSLLTNSDAITWATGILSQPSPSGYRPMRTQAGGEGDQGTLSAFDSRGETPTQQIEWTGGVVASGTSATVSFPSDAKTTLSVAAIWETDGVSFSLVDPAGRLITPDSVTTDPNVLYTLIADAETTARLARYDILAPRRGTWSALLNNTNASAPDVNYQVMVSGDSLLFFLPMTDSHFLNREDAVISCVLADCDGASSSPVTGAAVMVTIAEPDGATSSVVLLDDGQHSDGLANDGVYAAVFGDTAQADDYHIVYRADGTTSGGLAFRRVATGVFEVASNSARISGNLSASAVDADGITGADYIRLECWVTAQEAGDYVLSGELVDSGHGVNIAASDSATSLPAGTSVVSLFFDRRAIKQDGLYGPWTLNDLQLFEQKDGQTNWLDRYEGTFAIPINLMNGTAPDVKSWVLY